MKINKKLNELKINEIESDLIKMCDTDTDSHNSSDSSFNIDINKFKMCNNIEKLEEIDLTKIKEFNKIGLNHIKNLCDDNKYDIKIKEIDDLIEILLKVALLSEENNKEYCLHLYKKTIIPKLNNILSNKSLSKLPLDKLSQLIEDLYEIINS